MSAIATFVRLPISNLSALRIAAVPKKGWFGGVKDSYNDFLNQQGRAVVQYDASGYLITTLLSFLDESGIDLMKSEYDELSKFLCETSKVTCFILTHGQKKFLSQLSSAAFNAAELGNYYNEFNVANESEEVGQALLDGVRALRESLENVNEGSIVLLSIG